MRGFQIEIVTWAIQVSRQEKNAVEAILRPVRLRLDEHHFLCQAVWGICFFRVTVPKVVLFKRHRRKFWVSADRTYGNKLLYSVQTGFFDELRAHHQVIVEESAWILLVMTNAADYGCEVHDKLWICFGEESSDVIYLQQIIFVAAWNEYFNIRTCFESFNYEPSQKTCAPSDDNFAVRKILMAQVVVLIRLQCASDGTK